MTGSWKPAFSTKDLAATREYLYVIPKVAVTQKGELRKLTIDVGKERMVIQREPEHAEEIAALCAKFGLEYRGASLCSAVGSVMEKLFRPKRQAFSDAMRDAQCVSMRLRGIGVPYATRNFGQEKITATIASRFGMPSTGKSRSLDCSARPATMRYAMRGSDARARY